MNVHIDKWPAVNKTNNKKVSGGSLLIIISSVIQKHYINTLGNLLLYTFTVH